MKLLKDSLSLNKLEVLASQSFCETQKWTKAVLSSAPQLTERRPSKITWLRSLGVVLLNVRLIIKEHVHRVLIGLLLRTRTSISNRLLLTFADKLFGNSQKLIPLQSKFNLLLILLASLFKNKMLKKNKTQRVFFFQISLIFFLSLFS